MRIDGLRNLVNLTVTNRLGLPSDMAEIGGLEGVFEDTLGLKVLLLLFELLGFKPAVFVGVGVLLGEVCVVLTNVVEELLPESCEELSLVAFGARVVASLTAVVFAPATLIVLPFMIGTVLLVELALEVPLELKFPPCGLATGEEPEVGLELEFPPCWLATFGLAVPF